MDKAERRKEMDQLLTRWAAVEQVCADKHRDIASLQELIQGADGVRAQVLTGMPHGGPSVDIVSRMAEVMEEYQQQINRIRESIHDMLVFQALVGDAVDLLPEDQRRVIRLYYLEHLTLEQKIPEAMHYCQRTCYYLRNKALDHLAETLQGIAGLSVV